MTNLWLEQYSRTTMMGFRAKPLGWALAPLVPLSQLYALGMWVREMLYACGVFSRRALPIRVISVGNLTVGGTGKTPVVVALAMALHERSRRVGVISRGYGRRSKDEVLEVSDGVGINRDPHKTGDEPLLVAQRCPGVSVAVGADRYRVGRYLIDRFDIDTLILDDGFQHLALHRDLDILVLDATAPFGNGYLLPRGRLREPPSAVTRASLVLLTRARQAADLKAAVAKIRALTKVPLCVTDFTVTTLLNLVAVEHQDPSVLKGQRVLALSGIGNPESFRKLLESLGAVVVHHCAFQDHHDYSPIDLSRVRDAAKDGGADCIVTTEKDAVKLQGLQDITNKSPGAVGIWAARIELDWLEGRELWERLVLNN
jgi:tetraacyldisaccharide 4'-kinase